MQRSIYATPDSSATTEIDTKDTPLQMYEARNAFEIAKSRGA
jgi:hypothetical protein